MQVAEAPLVAMTVAAGEIVVLGHERADRARLAEQIDDEIEHVAAVFEQHTTDVVLKVEPRRHGVRRGHRDVEPADRRTAKKTGLVKGLEAAVGL